MKKNSRSNVLFKPKKILIACEYSGIVRDAFTSAGHNAWSCDILPTESPGKHIQDDLLIVLKSTKWDMIIAFPPCTYLCKAQLWRVSSEEGRKEAQNKAIAFVKTIFETDCPMIAIENPIGILSQALRPPNQIVTPAMFGDPHHKEICLWLKNIPPLIATCYNNRKQPVKNHTNGRMSQALKSKIKSKFFPLVAEQMAKQWGTLNRHPIGLS